MASPYPLPAKVKQARGNPGKRALHLDLEPQPTPGEPDCPTYLKGAAKREWTRIVKELDVMGILASADRALLSLYCIAWGEYDDAMRDIAKNGLVFRLENGYEAPRPIVKIRDAAEKRLFKLCVQFGFSPSARSKVKVPEKPKVQDTMALLLKNSRN